MLLEKTYKREREDKNLDVLQKIFFSYSEQILPYESVFKCFIFFESNMK